MVLHATREPSLLERNRERANRVRICVRREKSYYDAICFICQRVTAIHTQTMHISNKMKTPLDVQMKSVQFKWWHMWRTIIRICACKKKMKSKYHTRSQIAWFGSRTSIIHLIDMDIIHVDKCYWQSQCLSMYHSRSIQMTCEWKRAKQLALSCINSQRGNIYRP